MVRGMHAELIVVDEIQTFGLPDTADAVSWASRLQDTLSTHTWRPRTLPSNFTFYDDFRDTAYASLVPDPTDWVCYVCWARLGGTVDLANIGTCRGTPVPRQTTSRTLVQAMSVMSCPCGSQAGPVNCQQHGPAAGP